MKIRTLVVVVFLLLVFMLFVFISFSLLVVAADFELGNKSFYVQEIYGPQEMIRGWINISLEDIDAYSVLESNLGGSVRIIDFLNNNSVRSVCVPSDCEDIYAGKNGESSKSFSLSSGENKTLGVRVEGQVESIDGLKFYVEGVSSESCEPPLIIDILNDNLNNENEDSLEYISKKTTNDFSCSIDRTGCFELNKAVDKPAYIGTKIYCEKIRLPPSSRYKIGAWVEKGAIEETTEFYPGLLRMQFYCGCAELEDECELPEPSSQGGEISCLINYSNPEQDDFFVCIYAEENTDYEIKIEENEPCGFSGYPEQAKEPELDFYIFAQAARFDSIGSFEFNETVFYEMNDKELNDKELNDYIMQYIWRYDRNCNQGCTIPITFSSGAGVELNISNLLLKYTTTISTSTNQIYDTEKKSAKLNSDFLILDLEKAGFKTPKDYGNRTLIIELDGNKVLSEKIKIERIPTIKKLLPLQIIAAQLTRFIADVYSPANNSIVRYIWDFGNNDTLESENNTILYTYYKIGSYKLRVSAEDDQGLVGIHEFSVDVGSPEEILNVTLETKRLILENITIQTDKMGWYGQRVKESLGLGEIEDFIKKSQIKYEEASSIEDYIDLMANLTQVELPLFVEEESGSFPIYLFLDTINPDKIAQASGEEYEVDKEKEYIASVANWIVDNLGVSINYKKVLAYYQDRIETILIAYDIDIEKKTEIPESFLIIENNAVSFRKKDNAQQFGDFATKNFSDDIKTEFFIEDIDNIMSVPIYISPALSEFVIIEPVPCNLNGKCEKQLGEDNKNCPSDCRAWKRTILYIVLSVLGVFVLYIVLQEWYKKRYESHLFKNRDNLYNLLNFISNAKNQNLTDSEIESKLKKQKWSREQIVYALNKFKGKRTGMWEIPLFKFLEKKKMKKQLVKRQAEQIKPSRQPKPFSNKFNRYMK